MDVCGARGQEDKPSLSLEQENKAWLQAQHDSMQLL
jgi:hypothetical protein